MPANAGIHRRATPSFRPESTGERRGQADSGVIGGPRLRRGDVGGGPRGDARVRQSDAGDLAAPAIEEVDLLEAADVALVAAEARRHEGGDQLVDERGADDA